MTKATPNLTEKHTAALDKDQLEGLHSLEPQALNRIHGIYFPELYRYAFYRLGDAQLAEDLASETLTLMLGAVNRGAGPKRNLRAWLYSTISNLLHDHLRLKYRMPRTSREHEAQAIRQDDPVHRFDISYELHQALQKLTTEQQQVISLRFGGGFSLQETAELMGKKPNAIKALQFRALGALRRQMDEPE